MSSSSGIWFAILAAILAGAGLYMRNHGKPTVRKPLMIGLWVVAVIAVAIGIAATFSGDDGEMGTRTIESGGAIFMPEGQWENANVDSNGFSFSLSGRRYQLTQGELTIDGRTYGTFSSGDEVKLFLDGRVVAKGEERYPLGE